MPPLSVMRHRWMMGLNPGGHDSSAALLRDGGLVVIAEQERFSRRKRALDEPPCEAMKYCLDYAGISLGDVEAVALGFDLDAMRSWLDVGDEQARGALPFDDPDRLFPARLFGTSHAPRLQPVRHHTAHAASAFWTSGFTDAAVLVADDMGEAVSTTLGYGSPDGFSVLETYPVSQSLGMFYSRAAKYAGLYARSAEPGKLMGLAAYGRPTEPMPVSSGGGRYRLDGLLAQAVPVGGAALRRERSAQLVSYFEQHCFPFARGLAAEIMAYANFAASVQASLERALLELARELRRLTGSQNLVMAGGVALNCTANGRLIEEAGYDNVFVQPLAGDAGVSLGAAISAVTDRYGTDAVQIRMEHAYLGPYYGQQEIEAALTDSGLAFRRCDETELTRSAAALIAAGKIVGWYQGRAEVGPRALGARSLLGDPRRRDTLVRLNQLKGREMWRPVAPSVLETAWHDYFEGGRPDAFMIVAARVRQDRRARIPAVVHIDGSARPQAVSAAFAPRYARLIGEFGALTGVPVLANTSFNLRDEPIVSTPQDAVATYLRGGFDALAIGDCLVVSPPQPLPEDSPPSGDW